MVITPSSIKPKYVEGMPYLHAGQPPTIALARAPLKWSMAEMVGDPERGVGVQRKQSHEHLSVG